MSVLEQDIIKKRQVNNITARLVLDKRDNEKYEIKAICNIEVYTKESDSGYLLDLYYLVS